MVKRIGLVLLLLLNCAFLGTTSNQSALIASRDVVPASSDRRSVGVSENRWKNGFYSYMRMGHVTSANDQEFADIASYSTVYVSLDGKVYFRSASGDVNPLYRTTDN